MSAPKLTEEMVKAITGQEYDAIICNYANPDMVGHTGDFDATVKAIETIDKCLKQIIDAAAKVGAEILITADHGNAESMFDPETNQPHTAHTTNPVPVIYIGRKATTVDRGSLEDIAPTLLYMMGLEIPVEMTGRPLIQFDSEQEAATG